MVPEDVSPQNVLGDVDFRDEFATLADSLQWREHALGRGDYDTGTAARTVIANLGCDACQLSGVCFTGQALQTKQETGKAETALDRNALMLASSPRWLAAARISRSGADPTGLYNATRDRETTRQALSGGR